MSKIRRPIIAGNWKMNGLRKDSLTRVEELVSKLSGVTDTPFDMLVCPPATLLDPISAIIKYSGIYLGGQDCHTAHSGSYTGEISAEMLADIGCSHVIVGHSERRLGHNETNAIVRSKASAVLASGLIAIICIGETEAQRASGETKTVIIDQLETAVSSKSSAINTIVAYEPVWAIGTGRTPKVEDVQYIHAIIREKLGEILTPTEAHGMRLLYGGSVKAANAKQLLRLNDVDGALVGGASLNWREFWTIARSCPA